MLDADGAVVQFGPRKLLEALTGGDASDVRALGARTTSSAREALERAVLALEVAVAEMPEVTVVADGEGAGAGMEVDGGAAEGMDVDGGAGEGGAAAATGSALAPSPLQLSPAQPASAEGPPSSPQPQAAPAHVNDADVVARITCPPQPEVLSSLVGMMPDAVAQLTLWKMWDEDMKAEKPQPRPEPPEHVVVDIRGARLKLTDVGRLAVGEWFNDELVNMYGLLLRATGEAALAARRPGAAWICSSFFYTRLMREGYDFPGYDFPGVRRWSKSGSTPVDIFAFEKVLIPINYRKFHWALIVVNNLLRTLAYYDSCRSLGFTGEHQMEQVGKYLHDEHLDKKGTPLPQAYRVVAAPADLAQQKNGHDCGAFVCAFETCLAFGVEPTTSVLPQASLPLWRQKIGAACLAAVPIPDARH
jgi:hypothetical protein